MTNLDFKKIIKKGEGINVEFKSSKEFLTDSVFETIVSFLNTIGGYLFLGVEDNKEIIGVNEESVQSIKEKFANLTNNSQKINPPMPLMLKETYIDDKIVLFVYVPESSEVHRLNNKYIFIRSDDGDRDITNNTQAIKRLYNRKSGFNSEDMVLLNLTLEDFDEETINKAKKLATINKKSFNNWKELEKEEFLKQKPFYKVDNDSGKEGFTLGSLLLFGKKESIIENLPSYKVDVLIKIDDVDRYDDRYILEDNLIKSYDFLLDYLERYVKKPFFLDDEGRTINVVMIILRELVSNILIHREYKDSIPARVLIYKDKIVFENANNPRVFGEVDLNNIEPCSKNVVVAKVFRMIGYADEIGSGFNKIRDLCKKYFNNKPLIEDKDIFRVTINFKNKKDKKEELSKDKNVIISYIKLNGSINREMCKNILNKEKTYCIELLNDLIDEKVIFRHGNGRSTYYDFDE